MTGLDVLLAVAGAAATVLVVAAMILVTPRGTVEPHEDAPDPQGSDRSLAGTPDHAARVPSSP